MEEGVRKADLAQHGVVITVLEEVEVEVSPYLDEGVLVHEVWVWVVEA